MLPAPVLVPWLDRLAAADAEGLLRLYDARIQVRFQRQVLQGKRELADLLDRHGRRLHGLRIDAVSVHRATPGRLSFETRLRSDLGSSRVLHDMHLRDGRIRHHALHVLDHAAPA